MDEENLRFLVAFVQAFNERGWDGVFPFLAPDVEFHEPPEQPGAGVFRGQAAMREGVARWAETWVEQHTDAQEVRELPDGRILAFHRERMRGRDGIEVEADGGSLFTLDNGKVRCWRVFWSRDNALRAAGLAS